MCIFNGGRFLSAQLESIAAQTRPPDELVACDDGSSDGCEEVVREFARRVTFPTKLVVNEKNLGSTRNFEKAISLCSGDITALSDQDDVWYPNKLDRIEREFLRSGELVAVFSNADLIDDHSRVVGARLWDSFEFDLREQRRFAKGKALNILVRHPVVTGATMAFRRDAFDCLTPIPPGQIHDRWISLLLAARGEFRLIPEPLMQYRQHTGQQIGPGPLSLRERTARASSIGAESYREEIELFREFYQGLEERKGNLPYAEYAQKQIGGKVAHLEHRASLPRARVARVPSVVRQALNGNYWRYAMGWKSIAKDLVILEPEADAPNGTSRSGN